MAISAKENRQSDRAQSDHAILAARLAPVMERLESLLRGDEFPLAKVEELLALDPVLACQVLRHSQHPPAAEGAPVHTLWDAAARLGPTQLRQLCKYRSPGARTNLWVKEWPRCSRLLEHSLGTAAAARVLARELNPAREQEAYVAGFVLHFGRFVMLARHGVAYLQHCTSEASYDAERERRQFGDTFAELGRRTAESWGLAPAFLEVIDAAAPEHERPLGFLATVARIAHQLASMAGLGFACVPPTESEVHAALDSAGLPRHTVERLLPAMFEQVRRAAVLLGGTYRGPGDLARTPLAAPAARTASRSWTLRQITRLLRPLARLATPEELVAWLRQTTLDHTAFERAFLFLHAGNEDQLIEVLEDSQNREPLVLSASELADLSLDPASPGPKHWRRRDVGDHPLLGALKSDSLVVQPVPGESRKPPIGIFCCDRAYSQRLPRGADLELLELLARCAGQELELRRMAEQVLTYKEDSERDYLTGIFNRRTTIRLLERELQRSKRTQEPLSLILLDIDNFKTFNDIYGHLSGDVVLHEVAQLLADNARTSDVVGRYGGEEFLIVLPDTDIENAYVFAERLRAVVEMYGQSKLAQYPDNPPTISIGVSWAVAERDKAEDAIERVDRALYGSKKSGRNRVCLEPAEFAPGQHAEEAP